MERRPTGRGGLDTTKPEVSEVQCIDEGIDGANRVSFVDPIVQALRQKRRLAATNCFMITPEESSRES